MKHPSNPSRRAVLKGAAGIAAVPVVAPTISTSSSASGPILVGSANALAGMKKSWEAFLAGGSPLDAVIETVKVVEANPDDTSVGYGGLPNEDGVVQLDAACMYGPTHNSGAVAAIENILHPSEVARLVMERTDHCLLVGRGAYNFARAHGHPHQDLLTEKARRIWMRWKETMSDRDDRFTPPEPPEDEKHGSRLDSDGEEVVQVPSRFERHGTVHCSALSAQGDLACTTTTSGLSFKIPGRVGDSPIIGAGLYCDQEAGSAGSTGRGEAAILANGSFALVELMRQGAKPADAGREVLSRIARQVTRQARWQPSLLNEAGQPAFNIRFYILSKDGEWAGVSMRGNAPFAVADAEKGPRHERTVALFE